MEKLKDKLNQTTKEFFETNSKQSHKRTRLFLEMQNLIRQIKNHEL